MNIRIDFFTDTVKALEVKKVLNKYTKVSNSKTYSTASNFYLRGYEVNVTEEIRDSIISELETIYKVDLDNISINRIHLFWKL